MPTELLWAQRSALEFAGTSLNTSKWIANGASYTINNGLTYTTSNNYNVLTSTISFTDPYIIEYYGKGIANSNNQYDGGIYFNIQSTAANSNADLWAQRSSVGTYDMFYTYISGSYTQYGSWSYSIDGNMHIYTLIVGPNNNPLITERDYILEENYTSFPSTYTSGYFGPRAYVGTTFWQWVRVRAYPPNGVMPSFSIIQLLTPTISVNTSTNFQFNISIYDPFSEYVNYTIYLNGSVLATTVKLYVPDWFIKYW